MKVRMVPVNQWRCECGRLVKRATVKGDESGRARGSCSRCGWVKVRAVTLAEYPQLVKDGEK